MQASDKDWVQVQGKFLLNSTVAKATIYIEGPQAGVDLLLNCLVVKHAQKAPPSPEPDFEVILLLPVRKFRSYYVATWATGRRSISSWICEDDILLIKFDKNNTFKLSYRLSRSG